MRTHLFLLVALLLLAGEMPGYSQRLTRSVAQAPTIEAEMHEFWGAHLERLLNRGLFVGRYNVPEIQALYNELFHVIAGKYSKRLAVEVFTVFNSDSRGAVGGMVIREDGTPTIRIFMPALMDVYRRDLSQDPKREQMLEVMVVGILLHEMEHLALGQGRKAPRNQADFIRNESAAWHATCEQVLSIFVQKGYALDPSHEGYYQDWATCGRKNNFCWQDTIARWYSPTASKRFK